MKKLYVFCVRSISPILRAIGIFSLLDRYSKKNRRVKWLRSLFAIHNLDEMVNLDLPWWTFDAIEFIDRFLSERSQPIVYEWGSGASTYWISKRASSVTSIEHHEFWYNKVIEKTSPNVSLHLIPAINSDVENIAIGSKKAGYFKADFTNYVSHIDESETLYDLIVVDGRSRENCLLKAIKHLKSDGVILFDNSERKRYQQAIKAYCQELNTFETRGLTPCLPYSSRTMIISKKELLGVRKSSSS